ncbi:MAG: substrate-binding domain-containing protein [Deltaproteobacteria bacterium]|nr:substrate-binding domain-containing protein [Deltaproteobacteria bacterium]
MRKAMRISSLIIASLLILWTVMPPTMATAEQKLQYSCSAQVYEAFENARLNAFTKETGISIDLFVASSNSCIYRVMQDMTDIASSTRAIYQRQKDYGLVETPFCKDPLAIITKKSTPINNLSEGHLRQIFSGGITNWKKVGGPDLPITLVVPGEETGAHKNFRRLVMKHKEINYDYLTYKSTRVLEAIEALPAGAISFISRGAQITHPAIKVLSINGRKPDDQSYPYHQIFYMVTKGEPTGSVKAFVDFANSKKGRAIIKERGMLCCPVDE